MSAWSRRRLQVSLGAMPILTSDERFLCDYDNELGRHALYAVPDGPSRTYRVEIRYPDGRTRALREHVPSRRNAQRWALHYRYKQLVVDSPKSRPKVSTDRIGSPDQAPLESLNGRSTQR